MLVTFKSNAPHADVTMFGTAARSLLKMMGQSGNVPGAIMAEDIPDALAALEKALVEQSEDDATVAVAEGDSGAGMIGPDHTGHPDVDEEAETKPVALSQRATPLIGLLEAARDANTSVLWGE